MVEQLPYRVDCNLGKAQVTVSLLLRPGISCLKSETFLRCIRFLEWSRVRYDKVRSTSGMWWGKYFSSHHNIFSPVLILCNRGLGTWWSLGSLPTQAILWCCDSMILWLNINKDCRGTDQLLVACTPRKIFPECSEILGHSSQRESFCIMVILTPSKVNQTKSNKENKSSQPTKSQ